MKQNKTLMKSLNWYIKVFCVSHGVNHWFLLEQVFISETTELLLKLKTWFKSKKAKKYARSLLIYDKYPLSVQNVKLN